MMKKTILIAGLISLGVMTSGVAQAAESPFNFKVTQINIADGSNITSVSLHYDTQVGCQIDKDGHYTCEANNNTIDGLPVGDLKNFVDGALHWESLNPDYNNTLSVGYYDNAGSHYPQTCTFNLKQYAPSATITLSKTACAISPA